MQICICDVGYTCNTCKSGKLAPQLYHYEEPTKLTKEEKKKLDNEKKIRKQKEKFLKSRQSKHFPDPIKSYTTIKEGNWEPPRCIYCYDRPTKYYTDTPIYDCRHCTIIKQ